MAAPRKLPDDQTLKRLLRQGLTYKQIAEWTNKHLGTQANDRTVAVYVSRNRERLGADVRRPRYSEVLPWRVQERHSWHYAVKMLRLVAREKAGEQLSPENESRLEVWKEWLAGEGGVVDYIPDSAEGFYYVPRQEGDLEYIRPPQRGRATERRKVSA